MKDDMIQSMTFAAIMTALSELEGSKENEDVKTPEEKSNEGISFTFRDDIDTSNGRERLQKMLLDIIHDLDKACNTQSDTEGLDYTISCIICGILYRSVSEIDTDESRKIHILNYGLRYLGLDAEFSGEMFFGTEDMRLANSMINLSDAGLSLALEGAVKAGNPGAGAQFAASLTELLTYVEDAIKKVYPDISFTVRPWEIPLNFAQDYYENKMREMAEDDPSLLQPTQEEIEHKKDQEDAGHLLSVARKERQDNHMESAGHLYQLVLERMPENWEAQFYSEFCLLYTDSADDVSPACIPGNTTKCEQCVDRALPFIKKQALTRSDIFHALTDITNQCMELATNYFVATMNLFKMNHNTRKARNDMAERINAVIAMLFHIGDNVEQSFSYDKEICSATAAACWYLAFTCYENCDMPVPSGAPEHLDKIRLYDPSFHCSKPVTVKSWRR